MIKRALLLLAAGFILCAPVQAQTTVGVIQATVPVTSAGTPVQLSTTQKLVSSVEIHARKNKTTANTGAVYIGFNKAPLRVLLAGEVATYTAPPGKKIDLRAFFVDAATSADAVTYTAFQ